MAERPRNRRGASSSQEGTVHVMTLALALFALLFVVWAVWDDEVA